MVGRPGPGVDHPGRSRPPGDVPGRFAPGHRRGTNQRDGNGDVHRGEPGPRPAHVPRKRRARTSGRSWAPRTGATSSTGPRRSPATSASRLIPTSRKRPRLSPGPLEKRPPVPPPVSGTFPVMSSRCRSVSVSRATHLPSQPRRRLVVRLRLPAPSPSAYLQSLPKTSLFWCRSQEVGRELRIARHRVVAGVGRHVAEEVRVVAEQPVRDVRRA